MEPLWYTYHFELSAMTLAPRVIAVASGRGGSGKTLATIALGAVIANAHGRRVALVDLDNQGSLATYLGLRRASDPLHDPPQRKYGMQVFAGGIHLSRANSEDIMNHVARATDKADVVLVDCPPDVMSPSFNALLEYPANLLLAIARLEPGTPAPLQTLTGLAIANRMPHLVLPNAKSAKANSTGVLIALQQLYCGTQVLPEGAAVPSLLRTVPDSQAASTAIAENVPVTVLRPKSPISKAFAEVAADLVAWGVV